MIIGITGNIGSGKTAITKIFARHGYSIIDADKIGHELLKKKEIRHKIIKEFGTASRKRLALIVFSDRSKLKKLNAIMWPLIGGEIKSRIKKEKNVVIDAAVLIEAGFYKLVDKLIVVKINRKNQIKRLIKNKRYNKELINKIISLQLSQNKKLKYADYIIDNNNQLKDAKKQIIGLIKEIKQ